MALSFVLLYYPSKFFNLSHAITITVAAYFSYFFIIQIGFPQIISIPIAIILSISFGLLNELLIFKNLRKRNATSLSQLILSLGLYIVFQNLISLLWGSDTKSIRNGEVKVGNEIFGAYITNIQLIIIITSLLLFVMVLVYLNKSISGKQIQAISSNPELSIIFGIRLDNVILLSVGIGSGLAAISGILVALDTDMIPTMGFELLLYGVVVMIIGGVNSIWGLVGGALLLATAQHLGAYYIDSKWMNAIAFIILILFLIWKPLGFSGKQIKKIQV